MQFHLRTLLLLPVVVGGLMLAWLFCTEWTYVCRYPLDRAEHGQLDHLELNMKRYQLYHGDQQWRSLDAMLADFKKEPRIFDEMGPDMEFWRKDTWDRPRLLFWDEVNRQYILRSMGPNGRNNGGRKDDIQVIGDRIEKPRVQVKSAWETGEDFEAFQPRPLPRN